MIRIDLLHERETERLQRQRDPLKIGLQILGLIVLLLALQYFVKTRQVAGAKRKQADLEQRWTDLKPAMDEAMKKQADHNAVAEGAKYLMSIVDGRVLWGPVLALLQDAAPREVQYGALDLRPAGAGGYIMLSGIAAGSEPRRVAETFRQGLVDTFAGRYQQVSVNFSTLEETGGAYRIDGEEWPAARFDLEIRFGAEVVPETKADNS